MHRGCVATVNTVLQVSPQLIVEGSKVCCSYPPAGVGHIQAMFYSPCGMCQASVLLVVQILTCMVLHEDGLAEQCPEIPDIFHYLGFHGKSTVRSAYYLVVHTSHLQSKLHGVGSCRWYAGFPRASTVNHVVVGNSDLIRPQNTALRFRVIVKHETGGLGTATDVRDRQDADRAQYVH